MPFSLQRNDITHVDADAYVLAANPDLQLGGGVAGAIAAAAGVEALQAACDAIGGCPVGGAVVTPGFGSRAAWIIHAVGPVWLPERNAAALRAELKNAYLSAFLRAAEVGAKRVALPLISAGSFGCPEEISLEVAEEAYRDSDAGEELDVIMVLFGEHARDIARARYADVAEYIDNAYVEAHPARRSRSRVRYGSWRDEDEAFVIGAPLEDASTGDAPAAAYSAAPSEVMSAPKKGEGGLFDRKRKRRTAEEPALAAPEDADLAAEEDTTERRQAMPCYGAAPESLASMLARLDESFSATLLALIDARGLTDAQVYKRANLSRQHFSKIRGDADYRPTKKTVLALAVALELTEDETEDLLARAGFAFSPSSKADLIVRYFIERGNYDIFAINEALFAFDQPLLS